MSFVALLNSFKVRPAALPISGSLDGPKIINATTKIKIKLGNPILPNPIYHHSIMLLIFCVLKGVFVCPGTVFVCCFIIIVICYITGGLFKFTYSLSSRFADLEQFFRPKDNQRNNKD